MTITRDVNAKKAHKPIERTNASAEPPMSRSRVTRQVVMVVEVRDSWRRHEARSDDGLLDLLGSALATVDEQVRAFGGELATALGSRIIARFPLASASNALDAAIAVQRAALASPANGPGWVCAISLTTGDVLGGGVLVFTGAPLVGAPVDRALQLCSWTHPGAIVADERTVLPILRAEADQRATHDGESRSDVRGKSNAQREWSLGAGRVLVGSDVESMEYWEVVYEREPKPPAPKRVPDSRDDDSAEGWSSGEVVFWEGDVGRGFVRTADDLEYYVDKRLISERIVIAKGDQVFFVPRKPLTPGSKRSRARNPIASTLIRSGARIDVRVDVVDATEHVGFARIVDHIGNDQRLRLDLSEHPGVAPGDIVRVTIHDDHSRPVGRIA